MTRTQKLSNHALEQMQRRGITADDVESALSRTIGTPRPGEPGTAWIEGWAAGGRILAVCVKLPEKVFVVTAAWVE